MRDRAAVTVVVPVWDSPYVGLVERAVASVRSQASAARVLVVDNASLDELPRLEGAEVVRATRRMSAGAARNLALGAVGTDYVVFLDADDELLDGALDALHRRIEAEPAAAAVTMAIVDSDTGRRHRNPRRFVSVLSRLPRVFALATSVWSLYPIQGCAIQRTRLVREAGGYGDSSGGEDWVLAASLAFRGPIVVDRRPALIYHRRDSSHSPDPRGARELLDAARRVRARLRGDPAVPPAVVALLRAVAALQLLLIVAVRPAYRSLRGFLHRAPGEGVESWLPGGRT